MSNLIGKTIAYCHVEGNDIFSTTGKLKGLVSREGTGLYCKHIISVVVVSTGKFLNTDFEEKPYGLDFEALVVRSSIKSSIFNLEIEKELVQAIDEIESKL